MPCMIPNPRRTESADCHRPLQANLCIAMSCCIQKPKEMALFQPTADPACSPTHTPEETANYHTPSRPLPRPTPVVAYFVPDNQGTWLKGCLQNSYHIYPSLLVTHIEYSFSMFFGNYLPPKLNVDVI